MHLNTLDPCPLMLTLEYGPYRHSQHHVLVVPASPRLPRLRPAATRPPQELLLLLLLLGSLGLRAWGSRWGPVQLGPSAEPPLSAPRRRWRPGAAATGRRRCRGRASRSAATGCVPARPAIRITASTHMSAFTALEVLGAPVGYVAAAVSRSVPRSLGVCSQGDYAGSCPDRLSRVYRHLHTAERRTRHCSVRMPRDAMTRSRFFSASGTYSISSSLLL